MTQNKQRRRKLRLKLVQWHQRLGVVVAVLVLILALTGILLNHTEQLALDQRPVASGWLLSLYGIPLPEVESYRVNGYWINRVGDYLYLNDREIAYCPKVLNGVAHFQQMMVAACGDGLVLLTNEGDVIERIGASFGLPMPVAAMAINAEGLLLQTDTQVFLADLDSLQWQAIDTPAGVEWILPNEAPTNMVKQLKQRFVGSELRWERVILDLHSGRIATRLGVWIMDAAAVLMCFLALSGLWVWFSKKRH